MAYRCPHYHCEAASIDGLVQQVAVSYLRHGYWWYTTGTIPERKDPLEVDHNILTKYDIRKDWRFVADRKKRGIANLQYIRCGRFFAIMATNKEREAKRIRDARVCPMLVPISFAPRAETRREHGNGRKESWFEGYAVSYRRGGYAKKSSEEKREYREQRDAWRESIAAGSDADRPAKGEKDHAWHSRVEIERRSYQRLRAYFLEIALRHSVDRLVVELQRTPFGGWAPVKQQLLRIVKDVNVCRRQAGLGDQIPYRPIMSMRREIVAPFSHSTAATSTTSCVADELESFVLVASG